MKTILIIGANSVLAKKVIIKGTNQFKFIAATTSLFDQSIDAEWISIRESFDILKKKLEKTDIILNFGWSRSNNHNNIKLINFLLENKQKNCSLIFISSISASPDSFSNYSRNKYFVSKLVKEKNETNIMLGLVNYKNSNQIKYIVKLIKLLPFAIRFSYNFFNVYLINIKSFESKILYFLKNRNVSKNYSMYDESMSSNDFIEFIEKEYNLKKKFTLVLPVVLIKFFLLICRKIPFKLQIVDKILTFFYKNDEWIKNMQKL